MVLLRKKQDNRVMHWKNKHCIEERKKMYRYIIKNISNYYQLHLMADNGRFPLQILFFSFLQLPNILNMIIRFIEEKTPHNSCYF